MFDNSSLPTPSHEMAFEPLVGTEEAVLDDKGRIRLSARKAERLGSAFTLMYDPVGCLVALPKKIWRQKLHEILSNPASDIERDVMLRDIGALSEDDVTADAQGRFVIPQRFRQILGLGREVVLVGCIDRIEIWAKPEYEKFAEARAKHAKARREFAERGIGLPTE